jgi:hypothetical protein
MAASLRKGWEVVRWLETATREFFAYTQMESWCLQKTSDESGPEEVWGMPLGLTSAYSKQNKRGHPQSHRVQEWERPTRGGNMGSAKGLCCASSFFGNLQDS